MNNGHRLILGSAIAMTGSWIALTAVLINFQSRGGPALVTLYLFFLTLLPALLTRPVLGCVKNFPVGNIWCFAEVSHAALVLIMAIFAEQLLILAVFVSAVAVVQNIAASTQMSLVSKKVAKNEQDSVLTAISSGSSLSIVLGPAIGGVLMGWLGLSTVFALQAVCCICAVLIVPWRGTVAESFNQQPRLGCMSLYRPPAGLLQVKGAKVVFLAWVVFAMFGLLFDSVEMPVLLDSQGLSPERAGTYISFYGAGGVIVFIAATFFNRSVNALSVSLILLAGTGLWLFGAEGIQLLGFTLCGLGYALVNGAIRSRFNRILNAICGVSTMDGWAWLFQVSLTCSSVGFAVVTAFFYFGGRVDLLTIGLLAAGGVLVSCSVYGDGSTSIQIKKTK